MHKVDTSTGRLGAATPSDHLIFSYPAFLKSSRLTTASSSNTAAMEETERRSTLAKSITRSFNSLGTWLNNGLVFACVMCKPVKL